MNTVDVFSIHVSIWHILSHFKKREGEDGDKIQDLVPPIFFQLHVRDIENGESCLLPLSSNFPSTQITIPFVNISITK
jgi:hypothetical protein